MDDNHKTMPVDDQFLAAMGLDGLEGQEKQKALRDILYTLNIRVGQRVAESLSEEQAAEFENLSNDVSAEEIGAWLQKNVPNYAQIVEEEAEAMRTEVQGAVKRVMGET